MQRQRRPRSTHPVLPIIDGKEVNALLKRASPLPAMPAEFQQAKLSITVPISFALR
ncbi:MAG: hypothetical protein V2J55_20475 [Candidatus Competibacteraceae bacterium]|nr:hypothetical protein [Candidatus Competibacteraceae bacterium]